MINGQKAFQEKLRIILEKNFHGNMAALAKDMGIHRNQLTLYLSGKSSPNLETVDKIAQGIGISTAELVGISVNTPVNQSQIHRHLINSVSLLDVPTAKVVSDVVDHILRGQAKDTVRKKKV